MPGMAIGAEAPQRRARLTANGRHHQNKNDSQYSAASRWPADAFSPTEPLVPTAHPVAELYADHHGWLQAWLRKKLGCSHRAADLAHDTFLRLLSREEPVAIEEPRAFLATIAKGLVSNYFRRQKIEQAWLEALAHLPEAEVPSPETRALMLETLLEIDRRLAALGVLVRRAFLLSQLDGLPQAEIAARLGVSVPTVKRYVAKALVACCFDDGNA